MNLPQSFLEQMKTILGEEFPAFVDSYKQKHYSGVRVNELKIEPDSFLQLSGLSLSEVPWTNNGFYYEGETSLAKHPYYYAGLYYIQEPSAMAPAALLPIEPGDKVLDLCAAPGGKSTELGAGLQGEGLLVSNDISNSRAKALYKNIELFGIKNAVVLSEPPEKLTSRFRGYFDKILIDAPCSGEGMFRKKTAGIASWLEYGPEFYGKLQREILTEAVQMLKPGGMLLFSTCTFSPIENENSVNYVLEHFPDMKLAELPMFPGFDTGHPEWVESGREDLLKCRRLWPHKIQGEGHFLALLQKSGHAEESRVMQYVNPTSKIPESVIEFLKLIAWDIPSNRLEIVGDKVFLLPEELPNIKGLRILGSGLLLGFLKKNRFEPSQALAMALKGEEFQNFISLPVEDERVIKYLKCETISLEGKNGWALIGVDGYPLGWGKIAGGMCKNKYYPGWRWM